MGDELRPGGRRRRRRRARAQGRRCRRLLQSCRTSPPPPSRQTPQRLAQRSRWQVQRSRARSLQQRSAGTCRAQLAAAVRSCCSADRDRMRRASRRRGRQRGDAQTGDGRRRILRRKEQVAAPDERRRGLLAMGGDGAIRTTGTVLYGCAGAARGLRTNTIFQPRVHLWRAGIVSLQ